MIKHPGLPALQDCIAIHRPTLEETVFQLVEFYTRFGAGWNYNPLRSMSGFALSHRLPLHVLKSGILQTGAPGGRRPNADVLEMLWEHGEGRSLECRKFASSGLVVRKDLTINIPVDLAIKEGGRRSLCWIQPRKGFALTEEQIGKVASLIKFRYLVDDYEDYGVEIVDCSAPPRAERVITSYTLKDLELITSDEATEMVQHLVRAYDIVCAMGRDFKAEKDARRKRGGPPPTPAPDLFTRP